MDPRSIDPFLKPTLSFASPRRNQGYRPMALQQIIDS
jgi:hypothetical protein